MGVSVSVKSAIGTIDTIKVDCNRIVVFRTTNNLPKALTEGPQIFSITLNGVV